MLNLLTLTEADLKFLKFGRVLCRESFHKIVKGQTYFEIISWNLSYAEKYWISVNKWDFSNFWPVKPNFIRQKSMPKDVKNISFY